MVEQVENINFAQLLQQTYQSALERNSATQKHWEKLKEDYSTLESLLRELPKELTKDVMVPVAPKALMRGKIVHTNEILVCLGDGYFVKRSALQAADICKRREKICTDMLQSLVKEEELLEGRKEIPLRDEAFGGGAEIVEECNEEQEIQWREEHRRREREHRQRLAELREKERTTVTDEESLWKRLDELELQEELEEELDRLHAARGDVGISDQDEGEDDDDEEEEEEEDDDEDDEDDEDDDDNETSEEDMVVEVQQELRKKNGLVQSTGASTPAPINSSPLPSPLSESEARPQGRRVSFAGDGAVDVAARRAVEADMGGSGDSSDDIAELHITFSHSATRSSVVEELGEGPPRSPAELYAHFSAAHAHANAAAAAAAAAAAPRSILKKRSAYEGAGGDSWEQSVEAAAAARSAAFRGASVEREEVEERQAPQRFPAPPQPLPAPQQPLPAPLPPPVSNIVVERQAEVIDILPESPTTRPVSRFKAIRQLQKKQ